MRSVAQETAVGTYMSAYIEVDHGERLPPFSDPVQVRSLTEGSFVFGKDYEVFDALAGGRGASMAPEDQDQSRAPLFPPRGMPSPCSPAVGWEYFRLVADPPNLPNCHFWPEWRCVSSTVAAEWLRGKGSQEAEFFQWFFRSFEGVVVEAEVQGIEKTDWEPFIQKNAKKIDQEGVYYSTGLIFFGPDSEDDDRKRKRKKKRHRR